MQEQRMNENQIPPWQCLHIFPGYISWVYGVPITSDGKTLVSNNFNEIAIWDLSSEELIHRIPGHSDIIFSLAISPDDRTIASGSLDKTVKLWNLQTGELIHTLSKRADPIYSVAFSPDGKVLAAGGSRKYKSGQDKATTIYLWNLENKELIRTLSGHSLRVNHVAFAPNNKILLSTSNDNTIKIWNLENGELKYTIPEQSFQSSTVNISSDGKTFVSGGKGGIKVWDLDTGELLHTFAEDEELDLLGTISISPDEKFLAGTLHSEIKIWNFKTGKLIHTLDFSYPVTVNFSPDGKMLVSGSATGYEDGARVSVWRVPDRVPDIVIDSIENAQDELDSNGYFNPEDFEDARKKITISIARRLGQPEFRQKLLKAYNKQCAITSFDAEQSLEAAHIYRYKGPDTNQVWNGLLLRADIHTLFDLYLLTVHPETKKILIAPELRNTRYSELDGRKLNLPNDKSLCPRKEVLEWHYKQCKWV